MSLFKTSWIQGKSQGDFKKNLEYYSQKVKEAAKRKGEVTSPLLVILPELFLWDYFPITEDKKHFDTAITIDSDIVKHFQLLAKDLKIVLVLPIFEKRSEGIYHNSALIIESNGETVGHYRKMHIPDDPGFYEKYYFTPGDLGFVVSKTSIGNIGVLICWDQWFPEAARINALKGADIILYPTAIAWDINDSKETHKQELESWEMVMRSHAIANNVHVIAVNRVGKEGYLQFWGHSFLVDPYGKLIHEDKTEEVITTCEIDLSKKEKSRRIWPFFRDRRVDNYEPLLKVWDSK